MDELNFSLKLNETSVIITDAEGKQRNYCLRELTNEQKGAYLNAMVKKMNFVNGQAQGLKTYDGVQEALLCRCLHNEAGELVSEQEIKSYPAGMVAKLFKAAQTLSGLNDEGVKEAKND